MSEKKSENNGRTSEQLARRRDGNTNDAGQFYDLLHFHRPAYLFEFPFEFGSLADFFHSDSKSLLRAQSRLHLLRDVLAQMNFQFFQRHGRFDAGGEHLLPPFRDGLFEVKHIAPFSNRPKRNAPATIVRGAWPSPF